MTTLVVPIESDVVAQTVEKENDVSNQNDRPAACEMGYGLQIFRGQARGLAQSFMRAIGERLISFNRPEKTGKSSNTDVVNAIRDLQNTIDRQTIYTALPALHVSDEMVRVGFMAKEILDRMRRGDSKTQPNTEDQLNAQQPEVGSDTSSTEEALNAENAEKAEEKNEGAEAPDFG